MNIDDVSDLAKTDPLILVVGARIYNGNKSKSEKLNEVEKRVRSTMRLLSRILLKFRQSYGEKKDLSVVFHMTNLKHLRFAIEELTESEEAIKSGLKVQIQNVIKQSAKVLEAHFLIEGKSQEATDVCDFVKVFHLVEDEIFNGALYAIKQKRNKTTRKPANLPDEDLVQELKAYILKVTLKSNFIFQSPKDVFVDVRDAACARLTMFNGRRGGEPARLYVYQWTEALKGDWIRPKLRQDYIASVKTKNRITYQEGKGLKQVCVFFPPDCVDSMIFLCDPDVRREVDIPKTNTFVFPSTQQSKNHVEGWHALTNSCKKGGITSKINGTMNRHRVSSLIGAFNLSETDRNLAYDHFGHSEEMNKFVYQIPQAEQQLQRTGEFLTMIDNNLTPSDDIPSSSSTITKPTAVTSRPLENVQPCQTYQDKDPLSGKGKKSKRRWAAPVSDSDSDTDPIQVKRSFKWSAALSKEFEKSFIGYVNRTEKKSTPSEQAMKDFMKTNGVDESLYGKIKIKINNERTKIAKRVEERKAGMEC
eukprot:TCONS_00039138-protein